jgi:hypothetical protein
MQRDTVNINGHLVSGGVGGAEVIVGYLVRQIMEKAEILNNNNKGSNPSSANNSAHNAVDILNCSGDKLASVISSDNISLSDQMSSIQLTESQILAFARDLLVLCNRTQSGGTHSLTHSLTYSLTHLLTHLLTDSLTHSLTHSLTR